MKKNSEISRMFAYTGNRHWLTILSMVLAGLSTVMSMIPFVCIWFVVRDMLNALIAGDIALASHSGVYAWWAAGCSILSILLYFLALCCSHLAAFRTATNMKKGSAAPYCHAASGILQSECQRPIGSFKIMRVYPGEPDGTPGFLYALVFCLASEGIG